MSTWAMLQHRILQQRSSGRSFVDRIKNYVGFQGQDLNHHKDNSTSG